MLNVGPDFLQHPPFGRLLDLYDTAALTQLLPSARTNSFTL